MPGHPCGICRARIKRLNLQRGRFHLDIRKIPVVPVPAAGRAAEALRPAAAGDARTGPGAGARVAAAAPSPLPALGGEEQPWGAPGLISSGGFVSLWLPLLPASSGAESHGGAGMGVSFN